MLRPETIPRIDGDMTALAAHADSLARTGAAIADTGAAVHQGWQELATVYQAPEAAQLLAATGPVMSVSASVGEDVEAAAAALRVYGADTAVIQARLDALRQQATDLVDAYVAAQDESTTVTLDDRSAELSAAVAAQIEAWEAAQLRCANAVRALTGAPRLTGHTSAMTLVEHGGGISVTPPARTGPLREIFPIDQTPPISSTGNPPVVLAPGILINVPAPLVTGIFDGPGSYQPGLGFGPYLDKATSSPAAGDGNYTPQDVRGVADHLARLNHSPANDAMLEQINDAVASGRPLTEGESNFMKHETVEKGLMDQGSTYDDAHAEAMKTHPLMKNYDPEVIDRFPELFNNNWRAAWEMPPR